MGQGDKKPAVKPEHKNVRCSKCGYYYADVSVRQCGHPAVQKVYGEGGAAHMCCYCCRKCKHAERSDFTSALRCGYAG